MRRALPIVLLLWLLPRHASAQTAFEISGGYSLARDPRDAVTLPAGWVAGAAMPITSAFSAVVDVSGQYKTIALFTSDAHLSAHTVMGGLRAAAGIGRLTEFAQVLVGIVRASGSAFGSTSAASALGIQPGLGVDYPIAGGWAARAELDVRLFRSQPDASNGGYQYRVAAALVYRLARADRPRTLPAFRSGTGGPGESTPADRAPCRMSAPR